MNRPGFDGRAAFPTQALVSQKLCAYATGRMATLIIVALGLDRVASPHQGYHLKAVRSMVTRICSMPRRSSHAHRRPYSTAPSLSWV